MTPTERIVDLLRTRGEVKPRGKGWRCCCPAHDDKTPSLDIDEGTDHRVLLCCRSRGCSSASIAAALGLSMRDLFNGAMPDTDRMRFEDRILATYDYTDEAGKLLYQAVRLWASPPKNKDFRQRRRVDGEWVWDLKDTRRVPYRLPELLAAQLTDDIYIPEGEKDVDSLRAIGFVATTNPMGAGKWRPEFANFFRGRAVVVLPDNDKSGRDHAEQVRRSLESVAASVHVVELPGLPEKGDISDWIAAGGSASKLRDLVSQARLTKGATTCPAEPRPGQLQPIPQFRPFPVRCLPRTVQDLVTTGATAIGCDPVFVALPALAAMSAAIGSTRRVEIKKGWKEPPFISTVVIAASGAKKSPPYKLAAEDPAEDINDALDAEYGREMEQFEDACQKWEEKPKGSGRGRKPTPPAERQFSVSDITLESLIGKLSENPRGLLVCRDELDAWLKSFTRYAGNAGVSDLPTWLSLFNAANVNYSRKTGDKKKVRARGVGVAVTGTIQPAIVRQAMRPEFVDAGLFARLCISMPPVMPRIWTDEEIPDAIPALHGELLSRLYSLKFAEADDPVKRLPVVVPLDPDTKRLFIDFYNRNGQIINLADGRESAARSKLESYAARLALVFHCCDPYPADWILKDEMAAGIEVAEWFADETSRVYRLLSETPEVFDLRDLHAKVVMLANSRGGRVTARDLNKANKSRFPSSDDAERALNSLANADLGTWSEPLPGTPGRPTKTFTPKLAPKTPEPDEVTI